MSDRLQSDSLPERTITGLHDRLAREVVSLPRDVYLLDVGCGTGAWLNRLSDLGFKHLYGTDREVPAVSLPEAKFQKANLDEGVPELGDLRFDLIAAIETIEHLENPGNLFRLVSRYLKPNGQFLLTTPNLLSIHCRLRFLLSGRLKSFDAKGDPTHIYPIFLVPFNRLLDRYGLEIEKLWGYPEQGSLISRRSLQWLANVFAPFLPEEVPGDVLCTIVRFKRQL